LQEGFLGEIDRKAWAGSSQSASGEIFPDKVRIQCPSCGSMAVFHTNALSHKRTDMLAVCRSGCPGCQNLVSFCGFYPSDTSKQSPQEPSLIVYHCEHGHAHNAKQFGDEVPERLKRAFDSAVMAYNNQNYVAAMVMVRRSLEGIFKLRPSVQPGTKNLVNLIQEASDGSDMSGQLERLAHAIRDGGNLAAHFDLETDPDRMTAQYLVELVEYLIEYFFVLPTHIEKLEGLLDKARPVGASPSE